MSERKYFPINENNARAAHNMMSMRDYSEDSTNIIPQQIWPMIWPKGLQQGKHKGTPQAGFLRQIGISKLFTH